METLVGPGLPLEKYKDEIREATNMWSLTLQFGWTPKEIREMQQNTTYANDLEIYKMMLSGFTQAQRTAR